MPFHWYFTSALPRTLLAAYPLIPMGFYLERRIRGHVLAVAAFILLYSFLGHKEARFLFPALPILNVAAASALSRMWANKTKSLTRGFMALLALAGLGSSGIATLMFAWASHHNYPGGHALERVHQLHGSLPLLLALNDNSPPRMHICTLPAMTGATRFGEAPLWHYNKDQRISGQEVDLSEFLAAEHFDIVLAGVEDVQTGIPPGYRLLDTMSGFSHFKLPASVSEAVRGLAALRPPIEIVLKPQVIILEPEQQD